MLLITIYFLYSILIFAKIHKYTYYLYNNDKYLVFSNSILAYT